VRKVYLDQNKWIDLSRAHHGDPLGAPFEDALAAVSQAVSDGTASFPLSAGHYFETWKQRKRDPRRALAEVMSNLSQHRTIGDQRSITISRSRSQRTSCRRLAGRAADFSFRHGKAVVHRNAARTSARRP